MIPMNNRRLEMAEIITEKFLIRPYQLGKEQKMAALMNVCRTSEWDGKVTVDMIRNEWQDTRLNLDLDTWVAINQADDYIAVAEVWFDDPDNDESVITRHVGFNMHPAYRESNGDLMDQMLEEAMDHAVGRPLDQLNQNYVLRAWASAHDKWKHKILTSHGFEHSHCGYTMIYEDLADLPSVSSIPEVSIERWTPKRDRGLWKALNEGFSTEDSFVPLSWDEWQSLYHSGRMDPELWNLAVDQTSGRVVGLAISEIDREFNRTTNRKDGWIVDLAVIEPWRGYGIGRALLLTAMHTLRDAGINAVKMGIDSTDPSRATLLYDSLGFLIMQGSHTYHKWIRVRG